MKHYSALKYIKEDEEQPIGHWKMPNQHKEEDALSAINSVGRHQPNCNVVTRRISTCGRKTCVTWGISNDRGSLRRRYSSNWCVGRWIDASQTNLQNQKVNEEM
jgi:hypothetical protein